MTEVFFQLSLVILVVLILSLIMRLLKQPLIIGYIISGIILGPHFLSVINGINEIQTFSDFGIAFLLFIVGLSLSPRVIKEVGKISLLTGFGQIFFTTIIGYALATLLGFSPLTALYISIALTFSSTIIILKLLSDKGDLENLYGKIAIGSLLVQDFVAIVVLILLSSYSTGTNFLTTVGLTFIKGTLLIIFLIPVSMVLLPKLQNFFAKSQELLFIFSIAWGLGLASLFSYIGLSIEVGALIAGVLLSVSPYNLEMSSRLRPLRDFFIISFFLLLGSQMELTNIKALIIPALLFSLLIIVGNPLIVLTFMGFGGFTKKTSFLVAITMSQIGEFSLILIALGVKLGHISNEILSLITLISLITIATCTYMILYSRKLYDLFEKHLNIFERKTIKERVKIETKPEVILFGYNRIGFEILNSLRRVKENYLVVDFDPKTISELRKLDIPCVYGDVDDDSLLDELPLKDMKIAISTIPEVETNELLLQTIKRVNPKAIVILRAHTIEDAMHLYAMKADYVLTPHFLGGEYLANMLVELKEDARGYKEEKDKHIKMLKQFEKRGSDHPPVEKD